MSTGTGFSSSPTGCSGSPSAILEDILGYPDPRYPEDAPLFLQLTLSRPPKATPRDATAAVTV